MAINSGVNISKAVGYALLDIPPGVDITKAVAYAVLQDSNVPFWPVLSAPNGSVGVAYSFSFTTTGASPTTFTLVSGSLPAGLTLSNVSGNTGQITGTPTTAGSSTFTLRATNSYGTADRAFTIVIAAPTQRGQIDYDQVQTAVRQGSGGKFQMFGGGSVTTGHMAVYDSIGNVIDGGAPSSIGTLKLEMPSGAINGSNKVFTLTSTPATPLLLFLNGNLQLAGTDFTLSSGTITYTTAPASGDWHLAYYS